MRSPVASVRLASAPGTANPLLMKRVPGRISRLAFPETLHRLRTGKRMTSHPTGRRSRGRPTHGEGAAGEPRAQAAHQERQRRQFHLRGRRRRPGGGGARRATRRRRTPGRSRAPPLARSSPAPPAAPCARARGEQGTRWRQAAELSGAGPRTRQGPAPAQSPGRAPRTPENAKLIGTHHSGRRARKPSTAASVPWIQDQGVAATVAAGREVTASRPAHSRLHQRRCGNRGKAVARHRSTIVDIACPSADAVTAAPACRLAVVLVGSPRCPS